jgi:transcriptional regulator with XRE-family HTH domain
VAKSPSPATESRLNFARHLRQARRQREMTLEDLAEVSGMNWSYIAQVEAGSRNVSIDNAHRLAAGVGVPLYVLLQPTDGEQG